MKKIFYSLTYVILTICGYGQTTNISQNYLSPGGRLDNVFDHYGNKYNLADVKIEAVKYEKTTNTALSTSTTPIVAGYFNLYLEDGCGINPTDTDYLNRRNVITRVFTDISNFITSPLTSTGNKVNIWVRNIGNMPNVPSNVSGLASSFYCVPYNTTAGFGGIVDNEIWKTIHLGEDSYKNTISPLSIDPTASNSSGAFYHGLVAFRFDGSVNWNTNLSLTSITNTDLYSVALHEVTHALGFASLISANGNSKLGSGFNYYTRYDLKLKNSTNTNTLISNTGACNAMYNYAFNSTPITATSCSNAIKYVGTSTVTAYTPSTFSDGSSLSHFDSACTTGNFVMNAITPAGVMRRFYTVQEKNALVEMGYTVNTTFGVSSTYNGSATYTTPLAGIPVAGMNDGISSTGTYTYIYTVGSTTPLTINSSTDVAIRILSNDKNAIGFECLQDITDPTNTTSISASSGTLTTNVTFTSSVEGLHLLRYTPIYGTGNTAKRGNITYIYVFVVNIDSCATPTSCDLIINGRFENHQQLYNNLSSQLCFVCGWDPVTSGSTTIILPGNQTVITYGSTDYLSPDIPVGLFGVPCNLFGYQNSSYGNSYGGMYIWKNYLNSGNLYTENIYTKLSSNLIPGQSYQLSFDISLAETSNSACQIQAYFSSQRIITPTMSTIPISNLNMLFNSISAYSNTNSWDKVIINFVADNNPNLQYLYLGGLTNDIVFKTRSESPNQVNGCYINDTYFDSQYSSQNVSYYYFDNVSLIPLNGGSFNITPSSICTTTTLPDLTLYLSGLPTNGVFSGTGVSYNSTTGKYSFSSSTAANGQNTITYTYNNASGCSINLYSNLTVLKDNPIINGLNYVMDYDISSIPYTYSTSIPSGVNATWTATGGTIQGNNNGGVVNVLWNNLPGQLTLSFTSGNCTKTITINITSVSTCDIMNAEYITYSQIGNTINNIQYLNSITGTTYYSANAMVDFGDGTPIVTGAPTSHTYTTNGTFTIHIMYYAKQCSFDYYKNVTITTNKTVIIGEFNKNVNKNNIEKAKFTIYPNPTSSEINLIFDETIKDIIEVSIYTIEGKKVFNKLSMSENNIIKINSILSQGIYIVEVKMNNETYNKKIIIN